MLPIPVILESPTKNQIIEQVAKRADVKSFVFSKCDQHKELRDDLYQELFMVLLKLEEAEIIGLYTRGELHFKIIGTIEIMLYGNRSTFFNTYIKPKLKKVIQKPISTDYKGTDDWQEPGEYSTDMEQIRIDKTDSTKQFMDAALELLPENFNALYEWDKKLLQKYLEEGNNQAEVSRKYGINTSYISAAMQRNKSAIKEAIEKQIILPDEILPEVDIYIPRFNNSESKDVIDFDKEHNNSKPVYKKVKE